MKIAILGWGSLIWNPGNLEIDKTQGQNGWLSDGPMLPIEFARISQDGRLTLVIDPDVEELQTLYSISRFEELDHAILNLAVREGCGRNKIGHFLKDDNELSPDDFQFGQTIKHWIEEKETIEAVIWTNLSPKLWYKNKEGDIVDVPKDCLVSYLEGLPQNKQAIAEEYIRRAPVIVETSIRKEIEMKRKWTKINLPPKKNNDSPV